MASDDLTPGRSPFQPHAINSYPRQFSEYVLVPDHLSGKDKIFIDQLGFRPRNNDSKILLETYLDQARTAVARGDDRRGVDLGHSVQSTNMVEVCGQVVVSGWLYAPGQLLLVDDAVSRVCQGARRILTMASTEAFAVVRFTTNRFYDRGVRRGTLGTILDVNDDANEVEFSRPDGTTTDCFRSSTTK